MNNKVLKRNRIIEKLQEEMRNLKNEYNVIRRKQEKYAEKLRWALADRKSSPSENFSDSMSISMSIMDSTMERTQEEDDRDGNNDEKETVFEENMMMSEEACFSGRDNGLEHVRETISESSATPNDDHNESSSQKVHCIDNKSPKIQIIAEIDPRQQSAQVDDKPSSTNKNIEEMSIFPNISLKETPQYEKLKNNVSGIDFLSPSTKQAKNIPSITEDNMQLHHWRKRQGMISPMREGQDILPLKYLVPLSLPTDNHNDDEKQQESAITTVSIAIQASLDFPNDPSFNKHLQDDENSFDDNYSSDEEEFKEPMQMGKNDADDLMNLVALLELEGWQNTKGHITVNSGQRIEDLSSIQRISIAASDLDKGIAAWVADGDNSFVMENDVLAMLADDL